MKDLILKKRSELEEICRQTHMILDEHSLKHFAVEAIDFEAIDLSYVLEQAEHQISEAKAVAFSRKDILDRVDKWKSACEEECWLEEYSRDEHRYNGGRGGHLNLRRAEKARVLSSKIPAMVENLTLKTNAWEKEAGTKFLYDGIHLLSMLEDYNILRQEKEKERQRQRDQKKLQGRLLAEKEAIFGSKPSPTKSSKRAPRYSIGGGTAYNRRFSVSGSMLQKQNPKSEKTSLGNRNNSSIGQVQRKQPNPANTRDLGRAMNRDPFSPDNQKCTTPEKTISGSKTPRSTPIIKTKSEERNKVVTPIVLTPSTLSATSGTPYTPFDVRVNEAAYDGDFEYSFEEIRAGFVLPQRTVKSVLQF